MVDPSGKLIGMVSRRDLLSVFLRPDEEIAAEVYGLLTGILLAEPDGVQVTVRDGVVFLAGRLARPDLIPVAERLASGVDGVVEVICKPDDTAGSGPVPGSGSGGRRAAGLTTRADQRVARPNG